MKMEMLSTKKFTRSSRDDGHGGHLGHDGHDSHLAHDGHIILDMTVMVILDTMITTIILDMTAIWDMVVILDTMVTTIILHMMITKAKTSTSTLNHFDDTIGSLRSSKPSTIIVRILETFRIMCMELVTFRYKTYGGRKILLDKFYQGVNLPKERDHRS